MKKQSTASGFYLHSNSPAFKKVYRWQGYSLYPNAKTKEKAIAYAEFLIKTKSTIVPKFKTFWIEKETVKMIITRKKVTKVRG
jgi:uncharacterized protein Usg